MTNAAPIERPEPRRPDDRPLKERVLKGTLWFMSGTAARAALRLIVMAVLARLLAPEHFGLVGAASIFVAFAELFATSGVAYMVVQRKDLERRHVAVAFTGNLATGVATGLVLWLLARPIAGFFGLPALGPILEFLALIFPLNAVTAVAQKLLERNFQYGKLAAVEVASYVFGYALLALPLAWAGFGVWALVYAIAGSALVRALLLIALQPRSFRFSLRWDTYRELLRVGFGFSLGRYASFVAQKGDYFVVGRWLGAAPLGYYERAYVLMDLSNSLLTNSLNTVLFPAFAKLQSDREKLALAFARASSALSLLFVPAGVAVALLAPEIVRTLLGDQWDLAVLPFQILALGMFFRTAMKISFVLLHGIGATYRSAGALTVYAAAVVLGALATVEYGIAAVAGSTLAALLLVYYLGTRLTLRAVGMRWRELLAVYRPALLLTPAFAALILAVALPMRAAGLPPIQILLAAGLAAAAPAAAVALFAPRLLGPHGQWIISAVTDHLPFRRARRSASAGDEAASAE